MANAHEPSLCDRCGRTLEEATGNHYVVRIEARAAVPRQIDIPPDVDLAAELARTLRDLADAPAVELQDQVHRTFILHLCVPCYRQWIENPAGG